MASLETKKLLLRAYVNDTIGDFLQRMLNRRAFGFTRYEKMGQVSSKELHVPKDMIDSAILSLRVAYEYNLRERIVDAANYCYLAYSNMEDTGSLDGSSPGRVERGFIVDARGKFEHLDGQLFHPNMDVK